MSDTIRANGSPPRKTLASQLDRLDSIIDALAAGLNETVADVVRQAVTVAIQQAIPAILQMVLEHPEILQRLAGVVPTAQVPVAESTVAQPSALKRAWDGVRGALRSVRLWVRTKLSGIRDWVSAQTPGLRERGRTVWKYRRPVLCSAGIGVLAGSLGYLSGPVLSALALGLCGATLGMAGFLLFPLMQITKSLQVQTT